MSGKLDSIICFDYYEKEKLLGFFSIQKDESIFAMDVENFINNEIIIKLKDKSCHSVMLKDNENAVVLFNLIKDLKNGKRTLVSVENLISTLKIEVLTNMISGEK